MTSDDLGSDERLPGRKADEVDAVDLPEEPSSRRIWALTLAGPTLWFGHFMAVYLAAEAVCVFGPGRELWGLPLASTITVLATVVVVPAIAAATWVAHRHWRADEAAGAGPVDGPEEEAARGRDRPLAFAGFVLGVLSIVAVLYVAWPALWLAPC